MDVQQIQQVLPHRWPFLMVDRVLELEAGVRAVGLKQFTVTEPFFQGHFPGRPVVPGVLIVESLAQVGAIAVLSLPGNRGKIPFFAGIDSFRFRKPVLPGDSVRLEVVMTRTRGSIGKGAARALVDGAVVAEGELTFALMAQP